MLSRNQGPKPHIHSFKNSSPLKRLVKSDLSFDIAENDVDSGGCSLTHWDKAVQQKPSDSLHKDSYDTFDISVSNLEMI